MPKVFFKCFTVTYNVFVNEDYRKVAFAEALGATKAETGNEKHEKS